MKSFVIAGLILTGISQAKAENYTLLIYESQSSIDSRFDKDKAKMEAYWNEFNQFAGTLQQAGVLRGGTAFKTGEDVKFVTIKGDKTEVKNGSYASSKQILSGNLVIDVPDMDTAISYAKKAPSRAGITIEVRAPQENPTMQMKK